MYARNYNANAPSSAGRIPVQSFPEPGAYMGISRANHEHIMTPTPMPGPVSPPRPDSDIADIPNRNTYENTFTPQPQIDAPDNELSTNADSAEASATTENQSDPTATFSGQNKQMGLLERMSKSFSKHSGGILSELSTDDYIILALVALFLLGADNDGENGETLVPIVLAALLLL